MVFTTWEVWFAWHPIMTYDGRWRWLIHVDRRRIRNVVWQYRSVFS